MLTLRSILAVSVMALGLTACTSSSVPVSKSASATKSAPVVTQASSTTNDSYGFGALLNDYRSSKGKSVLTRSSKLDTAAKRHLSDMQRNNFFSHKGSNGSLPSKRVKALGYCGRMVAENITSGRSNAQAAFAAWKASSAHNKNMLRGNLQQYGIAGNGGQWVLVMADPC